jgi:hypothetical protein
MTEGDYLSDAELGLRNHSRMLINIQSILDAITDKDQVFYLVDQDDTEGRKLAVLCSWERYKRLIRESPPPPP